MKKDICNILFDINEERENPLISIIIPIYNVEKQLSRCITSVRTQTYKNLEIILVNDGSADKCGEICDKVAKEDHRIQVIHKENGGLSDARNAGLEVANGDYIAFIDSDDYVACDYIKTLYCNISKENADAAVCSFCLIDENDTLLENRFICESKEVILGFQLLQKVLRHDGSKYVVMWNKLYRRELFTDLRFDKDKIYEDEYINFKLFWQCNRIVLIHEVLYYYLQRQESIIGSKMTLKKIDMKNEFHKKRINFYSNKNLSLYLRSIQMYCNWLVSCCKDYINLLDDKHKKCMQSEMRKYAPIVWHSKESSTGEKIQNFIGIISLGCAAKLKQLIKGKCI